MTQVTLKHAADLVARRRERREKRLRLAAVVVLAGNVLERFDLPDVYRELKATKQLRLIDPRGAAGPT